MVSLCARLTALALLALPQDSGRLELQHAPGPHMHFSLQWFVEHVVSPYLAVPAGGSPASATA